MMQKKLFFEDLEGLRTIAALMVFLQHAKGGLFKYLNIINIPIIGRLLETISNGKAGVSIFFVLSGFLITYLILQEIDSTGALHLKKFYFRRILRIWPLYYTLVIALFIFHLALEGPLGYDALSCVRWPYIFTFFSNFELLRIFAECDNWSLALGVTWSIAVEEQFYLVWPLLFIFIPKENYRLAFFLLISASLLFRILHNNDPDETLYFHTFSCMLDLAIGALAAHYVQSDVSLKAKWRYLSTVKVFLMYLLTLLLLMYAHRIFDFEYGVTCARLITSGLFALIILHQCFGKDSFMKLHRYKILTAMGKYTYGIYLLHPVGLLIGAAFMKWQNWELNSIYFQFIYVVLALINTLILSYLSYTYLESRFIKLKKMYEPVWR